MKKCRETRVRASIRERKKARGAARGSALVVCLMVLAILTILGTIAILNTSTETRIAHNTRRSEQAFYAAEAGIEHILCLPASAVHKNDVIQSPAAKHSSDSGPHYEVRILDKVEQPWEIDILYIESVGDDGICMARRILRADIQKVAQGLVRESGVYPWEYDGSLPDVHGSAGWRCQ